MLDQAESPLHELELEFGDLENKPRFEVVMADVRNEDRMRKVFATFRPHRFSCGRMQACAYDGKQPFGVNTYERARNKSSCRPFQRVWRWTFCFVKYRQGGESNQRNGASKRIAEIYIQSLGKTSGTKFITTRFGNVLGSNGSVIPRFKNK